MARCVEFSMEIIMHLTRAGSRWRVNGQENKVGTSKRQKAGRHKKWGKERGAMWGWKRMEAIAKPRLCTTCTVVPVQLYTVHGPSIVHNSKSSNK